MPPIAIATVFFSSPICAHPLQAVRLQAVPVKRQIVPLPRNWCSTPAPAAIAVVSGLRSSGVQPSSQRAPLHAALVERRIAPVSRS